MVDLLLVVGAEAMFLPPVVAVAAVSLSVRLHDYRTGAVPGFDPYWLEIGRAHV